MVWQAAILISSTFRGPSQNSVRDENFPSSSERPSPSLIWNKLMKGVTQRATAEGQISPTQDLRCGHEVFMNQQGHKSTIQEGTLEQGWGEEGGKNGRKQGAMTSCQTQTSAVLSLPWGDQTPAGCSETYAHYWQCCPKGLHWGKELDHRQEQRFKHLLNTTQHHKTDNTPSSPKSTQRTKQGGRLILLDLTLFQQNANKES